MLLRMSYQHLEQVVTFHEFSWNHDSISVTLKIEYGYFLAPTR